MNILIRLLFQGVLGILIIIAVSKSVQVFAQTDEVVKAGKNTEYFKMSLHTHEIKPANKLFFIESVCGLFEVIIQPVFNSISWPFDITVFE